MTRTIMPTNFMGRDGHINSGVAPDGTNGNIAYMARRTKSYLMVVNPAAAAGPLIVSVKSQVKTIGLADNPTEFSVEIPDDDNEYLIALGKNTVSRTSGIVEAEFSGTVDANATIQLITALARI